MTMVNSLDLAAWALASRGDVIPLTTFRMDGRSYSTLVDWTRVQTKREDAPATAVLRGLHEVVSLFVPDVAFVTIGRGQGLEMTFTGHVANDADRRARLRLALSTWLGTVYKDGTTPQQRGEVADAALRDANWSVEDVPTALRGRGALACDAPVENQLWDALTAQAVRALAGRRVTFASGHTKRLVPTVPTTGAFEGVELVAFPPNQSPRRGGGYWTEVVTICTANFPERDGIHLLAHMSVRNWGEVRSRTKGRVHRSLDVFLPQVPDLEHLGPQRHGAFPLKVVSDGGPGAARTFTGKWQHREDENVFGVLSRLTGLDGLPTEGGLTPHVSGDGIWVLPRLGSVHGDKFLPGASGVPMPDRLALADAVGRAVEPLGLERLPPIQRRTVRGAKPEVPFTGASEADFAARRAALARALRKVNGLAADAAPVLDLFMFGRRDAAAANLRAAVVEVLGQPDGDGDAMRWADGLQVRLHAHAAGPLSEGLHPWEDPTDEDRRKFPTDSQWRAERARRQTDGNKAARGRMERWVRECRGEVTGACCAVLEIPEEFRDSYDDPFLLAKQVLAGARVLPQIVLVKAAPTPGEDEGDVEHRFFAAFSDLLRSLGVVPVGDGTPQDLAALTVAQVNTSLQAGMRVQSQAVPLAAHVRDGVLWAALPGADGLPDWRPYAEVYLAMTSGGHSRFDRGRKPDNQARFSAFWQQALRDISNRGGGLVLVDAASGRQWIGSMANGKLAFDRLEVGSGNTPLFPSDLPGVRVARVTHGDAKLPSYFHDEDAGWVSGVFAWPGSTRTAFGLKQKPQSNKARKAIATTSRHPDPEAGKAAAREDDDRKFAAIDETCAFFIQPGDDPMAVVQRVNGLRGVHAQFDGYTSLPYPLHELALLKNAITG
ncbi:RNaseH domain-containing protein [Belnapia rosea]|uniref:DUF3893 domain-containing protein n=1 Tax=Belnapia rosea TaxID=938405 RepID=A0A1G7C108_9PROT|nr:DUF3962 domain-containing protein [Belnapia rosea]SDE32376.1 hypothetical protein SAMN04487779_102824 [Belnapia rosea]